MQATEATIKAHRHNQINCTTKFKKATRPKNDNSATPPDLSSDSYDL